MIRRIGIIGYGYLGSYLYEQLKTHPEWGLEVAFVHSRSDNHDGLPEALHYTDIDLALDQRADLVVEVAHAEITTLYGNRILERSSYMPLSVSALADAALESQLLATATQNGTTLYVPHGAATGLDTLAECRDLWESVVVTMKKHPRNLDFSAAPQHDPAAITTETVLFDGSTRQICAQFPRNVNTHAAVALASIGFDRTRSVLIADPTLEESVIEIQARGEGISLDIARRNPLKGVSGVLTLRSALGCLLRVCRREAIEIV